MLCAGDQNQGLGCSLLFQELQLFLNVNYILIIDEYFEFSIYSESILSKTLNFNDLLKIKDYFIMETGRGCGRDGVECR